MIKFDEEKQIKQLEELKAKEEEELAQVLSQKYGLGYVDLQGQPINTDALKLISEQESRENKIAAFDILDKKVKVAILTPNDEKTQQSLRKLESEGYMLSIYMTSTRSLEKAWSRYADISFTTKTEGGLVSIEGSIVKQFIEEKKHINDIKDALNDIIEKEESSKISKLLDMIVAGALSLNASDIHIEPEEESTRLRFRLDGMLTDITRFNKKIYELILSRTKLISGLKLNIKENSQDGRFSIKLNDKEIEIRTSTIPGAYGESVVMRLLNPDTISVPMEELGIETSLLEIFQKEIKKPNGMILNTGPTGSGKTTTLYAFLKKVNNPNIKIITIEDPIEYHIEGITQTQTEKEKGYTFAQGLKSALRQDPDVIMVGEIRDGETAEIAVNSALTGHLVLSTLHTNTAAGTFPRLMELGVSPKILTSALNIAMAQRLVRKLCSHCKKEKTPTEEENKIIQKILDGVFDKSKIEGLNKDKIYEPTGCELCDFTGYKGRLGIFEAIIVDEIVEKIIRDYPSDREIKQATKPQGILDMREDGIVKVLKGVTSLEDLGRVIDLEEEL